MLLSSIPATLPLHASHESPIPTRDLEFFEKHVRPLLISRCYECHSSEAKNLKGGLRLDSRQGWSQGGDSGPAIQPGDPDASLLIQAVRYTNPDLEMPPRERLPETELAILEDWVRRGAPDPRESTTPPAPVGIDLESGRQFWSYQPPRKHSVPEVRRPEWPLNDIDRFLLSRLEADGLAPANDAAKATLVRRAWFDLAGLPPTPEQVDAFLNDSSSDAWERLIDRLLASPRFGERWGRHWLDVARFGESVTLRGLVFQEAWRYRDYVIDAFNRDLPFNQFIREQIAGDLIGGGTVAERQRRLIATTFLALGNTNLEEQDKAQLRMDVVDEQLDTIGKAFLGQTIGCARCHDHKFDPIPTRDYYALAGILRGARTLEDANVSKWIEIPLPLPPKQERELKAHEDAVAALQARLDAARKHVKQLAASADSSLSGPPVIAASDLPGIVIDDAHARQVGEWMLSQYSGRYIGAGYLHDLNRDKGTKTLTFHPSLPGPGQYEVRLAYSHDANRARAVPVTILSAKGETVVHVNQQEPPPIDGRFVSLGEFHFEQNNQGYVLVSNDGTDGHVIADAVQFLPINLKTGAPASSPSDEPGQPEPPELNAQLARETQAARDEVSRLEAELKRLTTAGPVRPMVMSVLQESPDDSGDLRVHIRGSVHNLGEPAPRGFLQVLSRESAPRIPESESGRRQLADWLASPDNPLPARVIVNRVWHWLFGAGLVRTPDNFGTTGELPTHPELLDTLAVRFMEEGWSIKWLVREITTSRAYRLATADTPLETDPDNRLLSHMNRRRLDAESIRDAMLLAAGRLQLDMGGPTIRPGTFTDYGYAHRHARRSVYVPVLRNSLPELFDVFDFADPSMVTGQRNVSTVAPQALFLMNHPFVMEQARAAAQRLLDVPGLTPEERITRAYRITLGRPPLPGERRITREFLDTHSDADEPTQLIEPWARLHQALFSSIDFRYLN